MTGGSNAEFFEERSARHRRATSSLSAQALGELLARLAKTSFVLKEAEELAKTMQHEATREAFLTATRERLAARSNAATRCAQLKFGDRADARAARTRAADHSPTSNPLRPCMTSSTGEATGRRPIGDSAHRVADRV